MDKLTAQQRHTNMAAIRSKDTKPEMIVRRGLWKRGFRYRLNHKRLPGHPDLVLRKYRTCIFVNGCFWHGHNVAMQQVQGSSFMVNGSACCKIPKTCSVFNVGISPSSLERKRETFRVAVSTVTVPLELHDPIFTHCIIFYTIQTEDIICNQ